MPLGANCRRMGRGQGEHAHAMTSPLRGADRRHERAPAPEVNEDLVRWELAAMLIDRERWPTRDEFRDAGHEALYYQAQRTGGSERWAPEFGLLFVTEQHDPAEDGLRAQLAEFLVGFAHWPSYTDFHAAGRTPLYKEVLKQGGAQRWAAEFGLPTRQQRRRQRIEELQDRAEARRVSGPRRPPRWTEDLVRAELTHFVAGAERFPSETEFEDAGEGGLYRAAARFGGAERWVDELGSRARAICCAPTATLSEPSKRHRPRLAAPAANNRSVNSNSFVPAASISPHTPNGSRPAAKISGSSCTATAASGRGPRTSVSRCAPRRTVVPTPLSALWPMVVT